MLDFTKNIPLDEAYRKVYVTLRTLFWLFCLLSVAFVTLRFIFPDEERYFDFRIYFGPKNTLANPRYDTGEPVQSGNVAAHQTMFFNASAAGSFSTVKVDIKTNPLPPGAPGTLSVVRAYRAFLYPEGTPLGFREGAMLTSAGEYYIVSHQTLRKFSSLGIAEQMGWQKESFLAVSPRSLENEKKGETISDPEEILEDSLFLIEGNYYQIKNQTLWPFVSERAYLSNFPSYFASRADHVLLARYPISDTMLGFQSGTLLAYDQSVYVVEQAVLRPIASAEIFLTKGYAWESVVTATGEEFGIYTRGKLYVMQEPHPNGTLFFHQEKNEHFLIENGTKRRITDPQILAQYQAVTPVLVDTPLDPEQCSLEKKTWWRTLSCEISLEKFSGSSASEYQFLLLPTSPIHIEEMNVRFIRHVNRKNFDTFVADLAAKINARYGE